MINAILIALGLSLDGFVLMMQTGATVRELTWKKRFMYAGVYTLISIVSALIGFGCATVAKNYLAEHYEFSFASLIVFSLGVVLMTKSYKGNNYVERLDKTFDLKKLARLAIVTNIESFALAAGFCFMNFSLVPVILLIAIIGFLLILLALTIGYNVGASYQMQIGLAGGALMIFFSVWILINYVLMRV